MYIASFTGEPPTGWRYLYTVINTESLDRAEHRVYWCDSPPDPFESGVRRCHHIIVRRDSEIPPAGGVSIKEMVWSNDWALTPIARHRPFLGMSVYAVRVE